jgi:tetrahydromethanopterin S-methyltransferase subunit G
MEDQSEPIEKQTTMQTGIRYGLILGVISIAYFVTLSALGVSMTEGFGRWGGLVFTIAIIFLAHKYFKENGDGYMSIGQGVGIAFWTSAISAVISNVFTFIYVKYVDEGFIQALKDQQYDQFVEQGMSDAQIDQAMEMSAAFMTPTMIAVFGLVGGIIIGLIIGLIISLFTQKKNPQAIV